MPHPPKLSGRPPFPGMRASRYKGTALFALVIMLSHGPAGAEGVMVGVAANFADAMRRIAPLFEQTTGHTVTVSFASTGMLYSQIVHGAPFDVFVAADSLGPAKAEAEGLAIPGTRITYARGGLVLWSVEAGAFTDGEAYLKAFSFSRAAIANPDIAPYGRAAREVMEHLGVWESAQPRLVWGDNVAQAFQFAATGNADVGFVARSQARAWKNEPGTVWEIPETYYAPITQQAVLLKRGKDNPAARAFLAFLESPEARRIISDYGYGVE